MKKNRENKTVVIRINSSKVYCKYYLSLGDKRAVMGINSSKVYCKY